MAQADVERVHELLAQARAICELARMAAEDEAAERLSRGTLGSALLMIEDLLGQAQADLATLRVAKRKAGRARGSAPADRREKVRGSKAAYRGRISVYT